MIEIFSYSEDLLTLNSSSELIGGKVYVYINGKYKLSSTISNTNITILLEGLSTGDLISLLVFFEGQLSYGNNTKLVLSDKNNSLSLQKVDILDYFSSYDIEYLELLKNNLLEKLKTPGVILNRYLLEDIDNEDFISFWSSIIHYLLLFKIASKEIVEGLLTSSDNNILSTFLSQRGYILSLDETSNELKEIQSNLYREISKRGSFLTFREENLEYLKQGEFLKLIRKDVSDEFLINLYEDENFGFNIGHSSPLYRGLSSEISFYKLNLEETRYLGQMSNNPYYFYSNSSIDNTRKENLSYEEGLVVSPYLDYTFSLSIQGHGRVNIGCLFYDYSGSLIGYSQSTINGVYTRHFIKHLNIDRNLYLEGFIYNTERELNTTTTLNIGLGNCLKFNENNYKIVPFIEVEEGIIEISNFKIFPSFTSYSRGLLQTNNFISSFYKNNSFNSIEEIEEITTRFLLPYHTHWKSSSTTQEVLSTFPCQDNQFENWQKTGNFKCEKILGVNTGTVFVEEIDLNKCTTNSKSRWVKDEINYQKCPNCFPNGVEVLIDSITCDCLSVSVEGFGCECITVSIEKISCLCN